MIFSALRKVSETFNPKLKTGAPPEQLAGGAERRIAPRHATDIEAKLWLAGHEYACTIRDLSPTGMTIAAEGVLVCLGIQIRVTCDALPALCGVVRWFGHGAVGVQFLKPLSLDQVYDVRDTIAAGMHPRSGRAFLRMPAVVRFGEQHQKVEVRNLSVGGLMVVSDQPLEPGQMLMVEFPDMLPVGGHVRWNRNGRAGVMFSKLLAMSTAKELARHCGLPASWLEEVRMAHETMLAA